MPYETGVVAAGVHARQRPGVCVAGRQAAEAAAEVHASSRMAALVRDVGSRLLPSTGAAAEGEAQGRVSPSGRSWASAEEGAAVAEAFWISSG